MKRKIFISLFILFIGSAKLFATEWTTYVCYFADSTSSSYMNIPYLRPVAYYECLSFHLENQAHSIMTKLVNHNPVFNYEKLQDDEGNLSVFLKTMALSDVECQELITSLLMHSFDNVTIVFASGTKKTYSKEDINMPFFLPVYFEDQSLSNILFIRNASEMIQLARKADLENNVDWEHSSLEEEQDLDVSQNNKDEKRSPIVLYVLIGVLAAMNVYLLFVKNVRLPIAINRRKSSH